jgi:nucleoside-diphosphate-sugar epimerase
MDYLVTGGMGFIGQHTIAALKEEHPSTEIVCLDNLSLSEEADLGVEFIKGDVRDERLVNDLVGRCRLGVIHLAADSRVLPSLKNSALVLDSAASNVLGTANILAAIEKTGHNLGFVYAGSSTAYGHRPVPQDEGDLPDIQSPYSATKLCGELLVRSFVVTFGIRATVLRYFQVYGPGQPATGAYALVTGIFLRQFAAGEALTIEGDGSQTRDFVHVTDVARANVAAVGTDSEGLPINIGSGEMHSIMELADLISPKQTHVSPRRIDLKETLATITRAKEILDWVPTVDFRDGIAAIKDAALR